MQILGKDAGTVEGPLRRDKLIRTARGSAPPSNLPWVDCRNCPGDR